VVRGGFARTRGLGEFVGSAVSAAGTGQLAEALASTIGDPSAALLRWSPEHAAYVDPAGQVVPLPSPADRQAVVQVRVGDQEGVAVVYDPVLNPDPAPVAAVARVAAIALDRAALADELAASRRALQEASARVLEGDDRDRRQLARDLHDGLQGALVRLSMQAHQLATGPAHDDADVLAARLASGVDEAASTLRSLVQGVMPAPLVERGLPAAVQELVHDLPLRGSVSVTGLTERLAPAVESTAYFVVAEALTNVVKHAGARSVEVGLEQGERSVTIRVTDDGRGPAVGAVAGGGTGLRGLRDRLAVLGGTLSISHGDGGTTLRAELPCGS
jgi:signal transduction histidine kinase